MKKILLLCTGGTIASVKTEDGLKPALTAEELLSYVPEVKHFCDVDVLQVCNIDSTNMAPEVWGQIVHAVNENYDRYDGFVITHGTDTMAYSSAALSYMIQNARKPIVITGSQKPINIDGTDAKDNLRDSIVYACDSYSQNVSLVFDGNVIAGTRAKKMMARSFNAFHSVNFPVLARIQDGHIIRYIPYEPIRKPVEFQETVSDAICIMKLIPGSRPELLAYLFDNYDCIVIESFGVGGIAKPMCDLLEEGLIGCLVDTQDFDQDAIRSAATNPRHFYITADEYANPFNKGAYVNKLDFVILAALEVDTHFNCNVVVGSDGVITGAQGGHPDTAAGAKCTIVIAPIMQGRIPTICSDCTTVTTPGEDVDVVVTDYGIAINPKRQDLIDAVAGKGLPIKTIEELRDIAYSITGEPEKVQFGDRVVGIIEARDGSVMDVVRQIKPFEFKD